MNDTTIDIVNSMLESPDIHHIFPKEYLKEKHFEKNKYNQEANYVYLDRPINISIGKKAPNEYFKIAFEQCETKKKKCGEIVEIEDLKYNLKVNCIPLCVVNMTYENYESFLEERRKLMAEKIKIYYYSL